MVRSLAALIMCAVLAGCASLPGHPYGGIDGGPVVSAAGCGPALGRYHVIGPEARDATG